MQDPRQEIQSQLVDLDVQPNTRNHGPVKIASLQNWGSALSEMPRPETAGAS